MLIFIVGFFVGGFGSASDGFPAFLLVMTGSYLCYAAGLLGREDSR